MISLQFWRGSGRTPQIACVPDVRPPIRAKTQICDTVVRSELGGLKSAIQSIIFFSHFQICETVVLESGRFLTIFHNCDTVVLDHIRIFPFFPFLQNCDTVVLE